MAFCPNCGAATGSGAFCGSCGKPLSAAAPASPPPTPADTTPVTPVPAAAPPAAYTPAPVATPAATTYTPAPPKAGGGAGTKILFGCLAVVIVLILVIGGGVVYVGYRAKKKADEIRQAYKSNNLDALAGAVGVSEKDRREAGLKPTVNTETPALKFPGWTSGTESDSSIPLRVGLTVVTAIGEPAGDYESMKRIENISEKGIALAYRADNVPDAKQQQSPSQPSAGQSVTAHRTVLNEDMRSAHEYQEYFSPTAPESFPGTTAITVSQAVLADLKSSGQSAFTYQAIGIRGMLGGLLGNLGGLAGNSVDKKDLDAVSKYGKTECTLKRVNDGVHAFPVLLNDSPAKLPAIHAQCDSDDGMADFYLLDNAENPLMLAWKLGPAEALQVIKIRYDKEEQAKTPSSPPAPAASSGGGGEGAAAEPIEQKLREQRKVDVYGIYFDFASDKLKPESQTVLAEINKALQDNPTWKLQVNGHTDNVGGDNYNLDLSQRRAAAVKQELVTHYHVNPNRLTTAGFGASQPKEPNDTLYGRARNRRVELIRED